jgi:hypothetical protein
VEFQSDMEKVRHSGLISLDTPFRNVLEKARLNVLLSGELTYINFVHGRQDVVNMASQFAMYRNKWKRTNKCSLKWP